MNHSKYHWLITALLTVFCLVIRAQTALEVAQVTITVSNLDRAIKFYQDVLTFEKTEEFEFSGEILQQLTGIRDPGLKLKAARLRLGQEFIELQEFETSQTERSLPADSRSNDLWFQHIAIVVKDMDEAYQHLRKHKVTHVSSSPQRLPDYLPNAAGISAFYFRDPDGHNLEIIHFPPGKGNARWQASSGKLFLGIDHTAIGIDDTDAGLAFYQETAGLAVSGNSENFGTEQERLNQVFGAHLLITGLKAQKGFGLEFLDYLSPPGGRAYPADSKVTDLWHWHTAIRVDDIEQAYRQFQQANCAVISFGIADFRHPFLSSSRAFLARDPDGHALLIYQ